MKDVDLLIANGVDVKSSLELFGEMDMYDATLNDFLDGVFTKIERLKTYKEIGDMPNYAIEVHSLKSDARYLGFTKLAELAYEHEMKSKAQDKFYVMQNFDTLMAEANKMIDLAKKYLGGEKAPKQVINENNTNQEAILVVDDSNIIQNFIHKIFQDNYQILIASDGQEALDIIKSQTTCKIVAMLLDLNMPNVDGFAVLDYFKENDLFKSLPVSIITGDDSKEKIDLAFKYPIVDMIVKPFNEDNIKRVIEKTITK